ncbi:MAG: GNAT family N-acetyltransferase [Oscillospiraceae bacterium]|nr:GNAT family N-acetyltransferase [Oscillospiraceae bacterium]
MEIKIPTREEFRLVYERDMKSAFPPDELKPLHAMESLWDEGVYRPWCMYEGEEIVGCACVWQYEPGWVLFEYLCVSAPRRNDGIGSAIIQKLHEAERGNVLFGESEIPEYAEDSSMAARRIAFYKRNGYRQAFYDNTLFGVPFHTLYWSEREIDEKVLLEKHQSIYRNRFGEEKYARLFNIPWDISMGMPERVLWEE